MDKTKIIWVYFNNLNEIWAHWDYFIQIWVKLNSRNDSLHANTSERWEIAWIAHLAYCSIICGHVHDTSMLPVKNTTLFGDCVKTHKHLMYKYIAQNLLVLHAPAVIWRCTIIRFSTNFMQRPGPLQWLVPSKNNSDDTLCIFTRFQ